MKPKRQTLFLSALTAIAVTCSASAANKYYKSTTAANAWTGAFWGTAAGGPYATAWTTGSTAIFEANGGTALAITGATSDFAGITANENVTVTAGGTLGTGGTVATINVAAGKTFNFQGQVLSTAGGTGFTKTGPGTLTLNGSAYPGGLTLSDGTVAMGGVNALGSGGPVVLAGGTTLRSNSTSARDLSGKPSLITITGDITLGDATSNGALTFNAPVDLGGGTRTLTTPSAVTLAGAISAGSGSGLTKLGSGTLTLSGTNTYDGVTTVSAGILFFQNRSALYNANTSKWNATNLVVNGMGSLGFGMGGTTGFTSAEIAALNSLTPSLGISTAGGNATISDVISGGPFTKSGGNTLALTGANTYSGGTTIAEGTLAVSTIGNNAATPSSLGTTGGISMLSGTVLLYRGTGETSDRVINISPSSGNGTVSTDGTGPLVLTSPITGVAASMGVQVGGAGTGTMNGVANTTALLNVNKIGTGKWTVNGSLTLNGGNIRPQGGVLAFSSAATTADNAIITVANRSNAGVISFAAGSSIKSASTNSNGILGAWATYNSTDWAKTNGSGNAIDAYTAYTSDTWSAGTNTNVTLAGADPAGASTTNTLRFNEAGAKTLTLSGTNVIAGGGILVTPAVGANATTVTGGTLAIANPSTASFGDLILNQNNTGGILSIGSVLANTATPAARTGTFATAQKIITGLSSTADLVVGMTVSGTGIAAASTIASINSATQITLNNNTTAAGSAVSLTFGANSNGLTKTGPGTVVLTGANTYTGKTWVSEGTLEAGAKTTDVAYEISQNATLKIGYSTAGGYANTGMLIHGAGAAATTGFYLAGGKEYNCQGGIQLLENPTTLRQYGTGYASLGMFDISANAITVYELASGSMTDANVKFINKGYGMSINIEQGAATASGDFVLNGPLDISSTNSGTLHKRGLGSLRLNAPATPANSNIRITAGSIICGINEALGLNAKLYVPAGGKLILNGHNQTASSLMTNAGNIVGGAATTAILTLNQVDDATFSGLIGGTGANENNVGLTMAGAGKVLTLTGANTYTGATTINAGTLRADGPGVTGTGAVTVNAAGTLDGNGSVGGVTVSATGGSVTAGSGGSGTLYMDSLTFGGTGTLNIVPGTTEVSISNALTASGAAASVAVNIGTVPLAAGNYTVASHSGAIGGTGLSAFKVGTNPGGPFTYTLVDSGGVLSLQVATSAIFWTGSVDSDWNTTKQNWQASGSPVSYANGNDVVFNDSASLFTVAVNTADVSPGSMTFSNALNNYTVGGSMAIAGAGGLFKTGAGTVTVNNINSFAGAVTVNEGTLEAASIANAGSNSSLGSGTSIVLGGGTLAYLGTAAAATDRTVALNATSSINLPSGDLTVSGVVSGTGGLTKKGTGTLELTNAANAIAGPVTVNGGAVKVDAPAKLGTGTLTLGGGALTLSGSTAIAFSKAVALTTGGGTVRVDNTAGATFSAQFTGTGGLTKTGSGTMTMSVNSNFNGGVTVDAGTLAVTAGGWYVNPFGQANAITINPGGTVKTVGAHNLGVDQNTIHINGGTLQLGAENYASSLKMTGGLVTGTGQLRTFGGTMTFNASAAGAMIETPAFWVNGASTLNVADGAATDDLTISSGIIGSYALTKAGDGKLLLKGQNTYTGNTVANAGTLELAKDAKLTFVIGGTSGTTNKLTGAGTVVVDGNFAINTTAAAALSAGAWVLEDVTSLTGSYGADFKATDPDGTVWANSGDVWTKSVGTQLWSFNETTGTLTLTQNGYDAWAAQIPDTNQRARTDDPDKDGFTNLQEYLFGTSPVAGNGSLATYTVSGGNMTLSWLQLETGGSYLLKESTTLQAGSWITSALTPALGSQTGVPTNYDLYQVVIPVGVLPRNFYRIEGTEN